MTYKHGALENEVLKAIWGFEEQDDDYSVSVTDVFAQINKSKKQRAYTTIKTVMDRLVEKNLLVRYKDGKKFCYKTVSTRNDMAKQAIEKLVKQYFNSDVRQLLRTVEKEYMSKASA